MPYTFRFLGFDKTAEVFIQKGADVDAVGYHDKTALIIAASKGK